MPRTSYWTAETTGGRARELQRGVSSGRILPIPIDLPNHGHAPMTDFQPNDIVEHSGRFVRVSEHVSTYGYPGVWLNPQTRDIFFAHPGSLRLAFRPPAGEVWEPWNGGEQPVNGQVNVALRHASIPLVEMDAYSLNWGIRECSNEIIAYRVVGQPARRHQLLEPVRPLTKGDGVQIKSARQIKATGHVVAVDGRKAWVNWNWGSPEVLPWDVLERTDGHPHTAPEPKHPPALATNVPIALVANMPAGAAAIVDKSGKVLATIVNIGEPKP